MCKNLHIGTEFSCFSLASFLIRANLLPRRDLPKAAVQRDLASSKI
jgi:hypothetical protein